MRTIKCAQCGAEVVATGKNQKYCTECSAMVKREREEWHNRTQKHKNVVPRSEPKSCVWVEYGSKYPYLPVAVADTAYELGCIVGVTENYIVAAYSHYVHGKTSKSRFHKVRIDT